MAKKTYAEKMAIEAVHKSKKQALLDRATEILDILHSWNRASIHVIKGVSQMSMLSLNGVKFSGFDKVEPKRKRKTTRVS